MAALTDRLRTLLQLRAVRGTGDVRLTALLRRHGTPRAAFEALAAEQPEAVAHVRRPTVMRRIEKVLDRIDSRPEIRVIAACDAGYPPPLLELHDPPPMLFASGQPHLIGEPGVAVVGTRASTEYGADATRLICDGLALAGVPVVSGLAHGIDGVAHQTALDAGGPTIAVIGCGIDVVYPREHASLQDRIAHEGLLLSEFAPGAPALAHHFPRRNRIIAALSRVVVVVEAPARSGALITVDHALDLGREVLAVPGPIGRRTSQGTNALIRDGATIVADAAAVLEVFRATATGRPVRVGGDPAASAGRQPAPRRGPATDGPTGSTGLRAGSRGAARARPGPVAPQRQDVDTARPGNAMSQNATSISAALGADPLHADDLGTRAGLPTATTLAALLELELAGVALACSGGRYRLTPQAVAGAGRRSDR